MRLEINAFRVGLKGLAVHKIRAALSMLGIIFGVASVVAVIAVSEGARGEVLKQLAALGANNVLVRGLDWRSAGANGRELKKITRLRSEGLHLAEAREIASSCALIVRFAPLRVLDAAVRCGEKQIAAEAVGTSASFLDVMGFQLNTGRWFSEQDEREVRRVCVIEDAVRQEAFPLVSPLDQTLVIDHEPYRVIGVLKSKEETEEKYTVVDIKRLNRRIYLPLSAGLLRSTRELLSDQLSEVIFQCREAREIYPAAEILRRFYESSHQMEGVPEEQRDYKVLVARDLLRQVEEAQRIFNVVMLCSAGISLLVGGIGIMNIMLANVSERRREVGIRRAVGATQSDILRQFLMESLIICLFGGLVGCILGIGFTRVVASLTQWHTTLPLWGMLVAVSVSLLDGVAFGTYPAWKAAKLDPIDALRYE